MSPAVFLLLITAELSAVSVLVVMLPDPFVSEARRRTYQRALYGTGAAFVLTALTFLFSTP